MVYPVSFSLYPPDMGECVDNGVWFTLEVLDRDLDLDLDLDLSGDGEKGPATRYVEDSALRLSLWEA